LFQRTNQPHSCKKVSVASHFKNKEKAKELFGFLLQRIEKNLGKCKVVSLPCCIHLFGTHDFLAVLPKKDKMEIRFALDRKLATPRVKTSVPIARNAIKYCFDIDSKEQIDNQILGWIKESYFLP
jgi:hypothetical protein